METKQIEIELTKQNFTDTEISRMREAYMALKVEKQGDEVGFAAVKAAKKEVKTFRIAAEKALKSLREPAIAFQKAVVAKEKDIVARLVEIEDHLNFQEEIYEPTVVVPEKPASDDAKITLYIRAIMAVKEPEMLTEEGKARFEKIRTIVQSIGK